MRSFLKPFGQLAILGLALTMPAYATLDASIDDSTVMVGGDVKLRLMPLGASITNGKGSDDGNGYRKALRDLLVADGNEVDMVGTRESGDMDDNQHEGWDGLRIDQVLEKAKLSVPEQLPNLITINTGTNDCVQDYDIEHAANRTEELLKYLWKASPQATLILSTLLVNGDSDIEERVLEVNKQLKVLAGTMTAESRKVILVDMHSSDGPQTDDLVDGTHPDSEGYQKMAELWFRGIEDAATRGWLMSPQALPSDATSTGASTAASATASSVATTPGASNGSTTATGALETASEVVSEEQAQSTTDAAPAAQASEDGSKAPQVAGCPSVALILALGTLVLLI
ncbi:SGNH hydrolase-type esterase domain-containing protein [Dactylonectria estremocensis]|uniref:SGNH hydrolase-type esterase domain-containing protein n=1 Tax=Dactylonectria estremocensis TaxID=1079267 RepID=A0A9P9JIZ0_9HYPO|nr:SGNH hydrolase-type esterase domain-containing protein [Dactylonectria estremocensis]